MKKYILVILLLSCLIGSKSAHAIFDATAVVQTVLKQGQDLQQNILGNETFEVMENINKAQGYVSKALSCYSNPKKCISDAASAAIKSKIKKAQDGVRTPGSKNGDLTQNSPASEAELIRQNATYKKGEGKDIERRLKFDKKSNARVADNIATLFAKGIVTRQSIMQEDANLYKAEYQNNNLEEVVFKQGVVALISQRRIARILELRSFMFYAPALKEMEQYNREPE